MFHSVFTHAIINHLVFQTNLYATQKQGGGLQFQPTGKDIKKIIAINILMRIKKLPSYKDYLSSDEMIRDTFVASVMSRNHFEWFLGHLHVNYNSDQPPRNDQNYDKLYKIRPLLEMLSTTFKDYYKPSKVQSIDESMIRFKGSSSLRQFLSQNPIKRGVRGKGMSK
ncbi:PiggyBac transposable element-derived protein 3 [Zootermopsis nevadensis]|uniref:PiggyBac transposable element-derived protein 3 n=1 Tax=Zootermopsis nevadensis TaxID=136037 RepID=A0A067R1J3_ZOONE|nr:PiggyBac transposable element-derived protein 3 [Zootermopsis nevadensis]